MEVLQTRNHYILKKVKNGQKTLFWNRATSEFSIKSGIYMNLFSTKFIASMINCYCNEYHGREIK